MAAPSGTSWGAISGSSNRQGRIGLYISLSNTNTTTNVTIEVWFWSRVSVDDSNNSFYFDNEKSSATTSRGSVSVRTTSNNSWNTANQVKIKTYTYSYTRGTSASTKTCAAKLTGIEWATGTMTVSKSYTIPALASYKITYNANGGSGAPGQQTKYYGKNLTLSSTKPSRTGYTFQGWATSSTGGVAYASGATYSANSAVTLYAVWKANTWTVKYDANGGTGAPGQQTKTYGVTLKLSTTKPTRTNYNFLGWGTSPDSTTVAYQAGADYTNNAAITLYAIWELAYIAPIISNLTADRCNSSGTLEDDGTYAKVSFSWEIDAVNSGGLTSIVIQWKQSSASTWNSTTVLSGGTSTSGTVNKVIGENALDTEFDYDVQITITDKKGNAVFSVVVPAMWYIMDFLKGGDGIRIGGPANRIGFRDQFNTVFSNGCANLNFTAEDILDPDTTHESLITTNINTPNGGYMYIHTTFYEEKSTSANRSQTAVPYNSAGSTYHRYYYNGSWSAWEKHVTESQLNSKLGYEEGYDDFNGVGGWYWRKYANGWFELYGEHTATISGITNVNYNIDVPIAIKKIKYASIVPVHNSWAVDRVYFYNTRVDTTRMRFTIYTSDAANKQYILNSHIAGWWK